MISPDEADELQREMVRLEDSLTGGDPEDITKMYAATSLMLPDEKKLTDDEAETKLKMYRRLLGDLPKDVLQEAFNHCAKNCEFFPKVAEIRAAAKLVMSERYTQMRTIKNLLLKHRLEWTPPVEEENMSPEDVEEANSLMKRLGAKTRYRPDGSVYQLGPLDEDPAPAPPAPLPAGTADEPTFFDDGLSL